MKEPKVRGYKIIFATNSDEDDIDNGISDFLRKFESNEVLFISSISQMRDEEIAKERMEMAERINKTPAKDK